VPIVLKSGSLNLLEPSDPVQAFNPLNAELNPIRHFLALLGAHHILHVSRIRVNGVALALPFKPCGVQFLVRFKKLMLRSSDMYCLWALDICEKCCVW